MDHEQFEAPGTPIPGLDAPTSGDFRQWVYSDIWSNQNRATVAEFMVGVALGGVDKPTVKRRSRRL
jgi:hypothetical protein